MSLLFNRVIDKLAAEMRRELSQSRDWANFPQLTTNDIAAVLVPLAAPARVYFGPERKGGIPESSQSSIRACE
jgi:hypothetical protein